MPPSSLPLLPLLLVLALPSALPLPRIEKVTFENFCHHLLEDGLAGGGNTKVKTKDVVAGGGNTLA